MKIILYIGHHKVGSTALQMFLSQNSHQLLQNGILYPFVEKQGAILARAKRLMHSDRLGPGPINVREAHNALAFRMLSERDNSKPFPSYHHGIPTTDKILRTIQKQIKRHDPQALILCSEVFSNFGTLAPQQIDRLRDAFPTAEFEIYLALRRPDKYIVAWQSQRLLFGEKLHALHNPKNQFAKNSIHFDYRALLEPWLARIPHANLILRPYSEIMKSGGSSLDFIEMCGHDFPDQLQHVHVQNPSIPYAVIEIARLANRRLPKPAAKAVFNSLRRVNELISIPQNGEVEMFGARNRQQILESFEPIHIYLNSVSGRRSFFSDYTEMAHCNPILEAAALRDALVQLDGKTLAQFTDENTAKFILGLRAKFLAKAA